MPKMKKRFIASPLLLSSLFIATSACTSPLGTPIIAIENQENAQTITPRTKGSTLEITPRTKGTTYLSGTIKLPSFLSADHLTNHFEVMFRQDNLPLNTTPILTDEKGIFDVAALQVTQNMPLYIEARSLKRPQVMLIHEVMIAKDVPSQLPLEISVESTAAVYTARYLNVPSQTAEALLKHPEVLESVTAMLEAHFASETTSDKIMDMPTMNASLEKARIMWMKLHNQETTP